MRTSKSVKQFDMLYHNDSIQLDSKIEYHHIHPFSDELKLLEKLKIKPNEVYKVDGYVKVDNQVLFVETILKKFSKYFDIGIYLKADIDRLNKLSALIVIDETYLTKKIFEEVILKLIKVIQQQSADQVIDSFKLDKKFKKIE